jgi:hypothetical protein
MNDNIVYTYFAIKHFFACCHLRLCFEARMFIGVWSVINRVSLERFIIYYRWYTTNKHTDTDGKERSDFIECVEFID